MMCVMAKCWNTKAVGWVVNTESNPERVLSAPMCEVDIRAAATIPGFEVHLFKVNRVPEGYK